MQDSFKSFCIRPRSRPKKISKGVGQTSIAHLHRHASAIYSLSRGCLVHCSRPACCAVCCGASLSAEFATGDTGRSRDLPHSNIHPSFDANRPSALLQSCVPFHRQHLRPCTHRPFPPPRASQLPREGPRHSSPRTSFGRGFLQCLHAVPPTHMVPQVSATQVAF